MTVSFVGGGRNRKRPSATVTDKTLRHKCVHASTTAHS